jgi:pilus assembly protein Flp/PilA
MNNTLLKLLVNLQVAAMREEGQDLVEYALITGLLAVAAVALLQGVSTSVVNLFTSINSSLAGA